jgi:hypothetical protein
MIWTCKFCRCRNLIHNMACARCGEFRTALTWKAQPTRLNIRYGFPLNTGGRFC